MVALLFHRLEDVQEALRVSLEKQMHRANTDGTQLQASAAQHSCTPNNCLVRLHSFRTSSERQPVVTLLLHTTLQECLRVWRPISFCEEGQRPARGLTV